MGESQVSAGGDETAGGMIVGGGDGATVGDSIICLCWRIGLGRCLIERLVFDIYTVSSFNWNQRLAGGKATAWDGE